MESPSPERLLLRDIALIYLALAHSTDSTLDDIEIESIAGRLRSWQSSEIVQGTPLSAIKEALEVYTHDEAESRVEQAIRHLTIALTREQRSVLLDDLMTIAHSDDRLLHEEAGFIGRIAAAWNVHPEASAPTLWNILSTEDDEGWTPVHDLAVVYLALAYDTDQVLSSTEIEAIMDKLHEWLPDADEATLLGVLREAMSAYAGSFADEGRVAQSVQAIQAVVPAHQRPALLDDLYHVASADGVVLDAERRWIAELANAWGLQQGVPS